VCGGARVCFFYGFLEKKKKKTLQQLMEHWVVARGYDVVDAANVRIPGYTAPARTSFVATSVDVDLPHILDKICASTISVRVLQKTISKQYAVRETETEENTEQNPRYRKIARTETRQLFLFVRNIMEKKCSKKDIVFLCTKYLPLADCIFFASGVAPLLEQAFYRRGIECKHEVQLLPLKDVTFDKLETRLVPKYIVLNEAEVCALEQAKKCSRDQFPRLRATVDAMGRYLWLRPGTVVQTSRTHYRIVTH
jgi:DNA-directed RNA polymerase subunit H (RpoH/RPB5)